MKTKPAYNQEWLDMEMKRRLAETPVTQCRSGDKIPAEIVAIMLSMHPTVEKSTHTFILLDNGTVEWKINIGDETEEANGSQVRAYDDFLPFLREELALSSTNIVIYEFSK